MHAERLLFLPGAGGNADFWRPLSGLLSHPAERIFHAWPGFGGRPSRDDVRSLADMLPEVLEWIDRPVDIIAQSMGGVLAVQAALARPEWVRHLVLVATSGGIDIARHGAADWRPGYLRNLPDAPRWFAEDRTELEPRLSELRMPVLLVWGDADPISPVAVGEHLMQRIPSANLVVLAGGDHDLGLTRATELAPTVARHLER